MRAKTMRGLPVIEIGEGSTVGRVQDLVIDPIGKKVVGLMVSEKSYLKGKSHLIPFPEIHSIGQDAVIVKSKDALGSTDHPDLDLFRDYSVFGKNIISTNGNYIARVQDFAFSGETGEIESMIISDLKEREKTGQEVFLAKEAILNMGKDYIIAEHNFSTYISEGMVEKERAESIPRAKEPFYSLEAHAVDFALHKEAAHGVRDLHGKVIVEKGQRITPEIIENARAAGKFYQVLFAAGIGELLDNIDYTVEILDQGGQRLLDAWESFKKKSQQIFRTAPTRQKGETPAGLETEGDGSTQIENEEPGEGAPASPADIDVFDSLKAIYTHIKQEMATEGKMLSRESKERMKEYIHGKVANYTVRDNQGRVLVEREQKITEEMIRWAEADNKIPNLFFAAITQEIEVNLRLIGEKLSDTFR